MEGRQKFVLIGPPGAGKSTVGKRLAKELGCSFSDTDSLIEEGERRSISDIFLDSGEAGFRRIEEGVVLKALESSTGVIALGGGSILSARVREELAKDSCVVIYLTVSISQAAPRVGFNKDRPLLMINPRQQWQNLMADRAPIYESLADLSISTDNAKPAEIVTMIVEKMELKP